MQDSPGDSAAVVRPNDARAHVLRTVARRPAFWLVSLAAAGAAAVVIGVPTVVIPSPFFARMTPVRPLDYTVWIATAVLAGLLAATYFPSVTGVAASCPAQPERLTFGGVLSALAVGCPVCNKVVVLLLGSSGAMAYFAPLQPVLGAAGVALLAMTLVARLRALGDGGAVQLT